MRPVKYRFGSYVLTGLTAPAMEEQERLATVCTHPEERANAAWHPVQKEKPPGAIPFAAPGGLLRGSPWGAPPRLGVMITGAG